MTPSSNAPPSPLHATGRVTAAVVALPILVGVLTLLAIFLTTIETGDAALVSAVWFAGGIGIGALYVSDLRRWLAFLLAIAVGALVAFLLQGLPFVWTLASVAIALVVSACTARVLKAWLPPEHAFDASAQVLLLWAIGALGSALLAALLGAGALSLLGMGAGTGDEVVDGAGFLNNFRVWFVADLTGATLVLPLVVAWSRGRSSARGARAACAARRSPPVR